MRLNSRVLAFLTLAALTLGTLAPAQASFINGTQGFADIGVATINTTDLGSATVFNIGSLLTTAAETGDFANPNSTYLSLGAATLDLSNVGAFKFGTADFGMFAGSSLQTLTSSSAIQSFYILGTFSPGTRYGANSGSPVAASISIVFTQTNVGGRFISDTATMSVPPTNAVPEPASIAMLGLGLTGLVFRRRRRAG